MFVLLKINELNLPILLIYFRLFRCDVSVVALTLSMIFGVCSGVLAIVARCVTIYSLDIISNVFVLFRLIYLDGLNICFFAVFLV